MPPEVPREAAEHEIAEVLALRFAVFCEEQGVPRELEHDAHDATALHIVIERDGVIVGTCRLVGGPEVVRLGRMAVARTHRGAGLGGLLLSHAHSLAEATGAREIELHAQIAVRGFYERAGYDGEGEAFEEAGIEHVRMRRRLSRA